MNKEPTRYNMSTGKPVTPKIKKYSLKSIREEAKREDENIKKGRET